MTLLREERVQELSGSSYLVLKESHALVRELKGMVDRLHQSGLQGDTRTSFDQLAAIKLTADRLYDGLERYLRPECDPDSAFDTAMTEDPKE